MSGCSDINSGLPLHDFRGGPGESIPLRVKSLEGMDDTGWAKYPHRHNFYEVIYVINGRGQHVIDFDAFSIQPRSFYFISRGQVHFWKTNLPVQGYAVTFTDDFLLLTPADKNLLSELVFFHTIESSPHLRLTPKQVSSVIPLLQDLDREYKGKGINYVSVCRAYLHILLITVQRIYDAMDAQRDLREAPALVREFKRLVSERCSQERSLPALACRLGVTASHLNEAVKKVTGFTSGQLIRQALALEAKRLIGNTDVNLEQIARSLRFDDPSYFARFFKRETGMSPRGFRRHVRGKYQIFPE